MVQFSASPIRIVYSIAARLVTGSEPGRPRQTGQTSEFGSPPNRAGQPQNIFVSVPSSTCTSRPMSGSYRVSAWSNGTNAAPAPPPPRPPARSSCQPLRVVEQRMAAAAVQRRLDRGADPVDPVVGERRRHDLQPD